jgi:hypothetical protein
MYGRIAASQLPPPILYFHKLIKSCESNRPSKLNSSPDSIGPRRQTISIPAPQHQSKAQDVRLTERVADLLASVKGGTVDRQVGA